jgi:hypothetical protein
MISSPKTNKFHSAPNKRTRTVSEPKDGFIDDNTTDEEIIQETENDNEVNLIFDNEIIKNLDSLLLKLEADLKRSKDLLANVKAHEDLCAKSVKELKNTKKSYIKVCTYAYYMNFGNIVPEFIGAATLASPTIVVTNAATALIAATAATSEEP